MSYLVQGLCVLAALIGLTAVSGKVESEQIRYSSPYVIVGLPLILLVLIGVGRRILEKLDAVERKLDEASKAKGV